MIELGDYELEKAIDAINQNVHSNKVFLFGSYANENPSKNSDFDLCILIDKLEGRKIDKLRKIRYSLAENVNIPVDLLLYTSKEFNESAHISSTLEYKILNEGELVQWILFGMTQN